MVADWDDFGANHIISDMCQAHDCRDKLDQLHYTNPNFKATLFTIPGEMTAELMKWCDANRGWIELAAHGFYHTSNYECSEMTYEEFDGFMDELGGVIEPLFVKGFKAPGWQISDGAYQWLQDHDWWVADQSYNDERRPKELQAYVNHNGLFYSYKDRVESIPAWHGHTWDCVGNGIYETFEHVKNLVQNADSFEFVSEVV